MGRETVETQDMKCIWDLFQLLVTFKEMEDEVRQGMEEDAGGRI